MSIENRRGHEVAQKSQEYSRIIYSRYTRLLESIGMVNKLPKEQALGIIGVDGKEYPLPKIEDISELLKQNKDLIDQKNNQGFTRLLIVPFALPVTTLIEKTDIVIRRHKLTDKLFQTKLNPQDPDVPVKNDGYNPLWMMDNLEPKDLDRMVYFPSFFLPDHKGKTKQEVISDPKICAFPGWSIGLIENKHVIPSKGQGKIIGGRQQMETDLTKNDYLRVIKRQKETGWTLEDFLTNFATILEKNNQVSDILSQFNGKFITGQYLPILSGEKQDFVPAAAWDSRSSKLGLYKCDPNAHNERWGTRSTVRLVFG